MLRKKILPNLIFILIVSITLAFLPSTTQAQETLENNKKGYTSGIKRVAATSNKRSNDLWARIRNGFSLAGMRSQEVRHNENRFTRHQKYIDQIVERSRRYLFHIVEEVERRGMPNGDCTYSYYRKCF